MHPFARSLLVLTLAVAPSAAREAQAGAPSAAAPTTPATARAQSARPATGPSDVAARAGDDVVTFAELDALLLERHATSERGKAMAMYLGQRALIGHLAAEAGIEVTDAAIDRRTTKLDGEIRGQGVAGGLAEVLAEEGIGRDEFRDTLRLALMHEELTRRALGLPPDAEVTGDQQQLWLDAECSRAGLEVHAPPYADGVAGRLGPAAIDAAELGRLLRDKAEDGELTESLTQLLLLRRIERRVTDLAPERRAELVAAEVQRRRADAEQDPRFKGVAFEELLKAQGHTVERLARDPAVCIAALSTHWVDTQHDDASLRAFHDENAQFFADHFGEAVHVRAIFLSAAERPNELVPRSLAQAEDELERLAARIGGAEEFAVLASAHSEDTDTRARGGEVGWLVRASRTLPKDLLARVFDARPGLLGPARIPNGVLLLWVGEHRPAPSWEGMRPHVHRELRRRFLIETLPPSDVHTYLDADFDAGPRPATAPAPVRPTDGGE